MSLIVDKFDLILKMAFALARFHDFGFVHRNLSGKSFYAFHNGIIVLGDFSKISHMNFYIENNYYLMEKNEIKY